MRKFFGNFRARINEFLGSRKTLGILIVIFLILAMLFFINYLARLHVESLLNENLINSASIPNTLNEFIRTYAQIAGGLVILAGLYFTYRRIKATENNVQIAQERQITERYTTAVEQLDSTKTSIRIGALFGLQRIAKDSEKDILAICKIISSYMQDNGKNILEYRFDKPEDLLGNLEQYLTPNDVEEALRIWLNLASINNGTEYTKLDEIDFARVNLSENEYSNAHLSNIKFVQSNFYNLVLEKLGFFQTLLIGVNFYKSKIIKNKFFASNFQSSSIDDSSFNDVQFQFSHFYKSQAEKYKLVDSKVESSTWSKTNFKKTLIKGTDFIDAKLIENTFDDSIIENSSFSHSKIKKSSFKNCKIRNTSFIETSIDRLEHDNLAFENCKFYNCNINVENFRSLIDDKTSLKNTIA